MHRIARRLPFSSEYSSSSTHTKRVLTEISGLLRGSNVFQRGRSFAAAVPSDDSKVQNGGKKVSKALRRAMVESYVIKYKAMNAGKFPTASDTKKQVGGSYYVVKRFLQELEYGSKIAPMNTRHENALGEKVAGINRKAADVASRLIMNPVTSEDVHTVKSDDVDPGHSELKNIGAVKEPSTSTFFRKALSEEVVKPKTEDDTSSYIVKQKHEARIEAEELVLSSSERLEYNVKERSPPEGPHTKKQRHEPSPESDKLAKGMSEKQNDSEELPKQPSMWGNLKSLADGIIQIWKRL